MLSDSSRPSATPVSMTEILNWIDPTALPRKVRTALQEIGPFLARGLTYREIGTEVGRSEDWVAARVAEIREALVAEALKRADSMRDDVRERIEALSRSSTA
jgi:predicted MarR family transcription regulator